jgi:hypothetical protein
VPVGICLKAITLYSSLLLDGELLPFKYRQTILIGLRLPSPLAQFRLQRIERFASQAETTIALT